MFKQLELFHFDKVPYGHCPECYQKYSIDRMHDWTLLCTYCKKRVDKSKWETVVRQDFPYTVSVDSASVSW